MQKKQNNVEEKQLNNKLDNKNRKVNQQMYSIQISFLQTNKLSLVLVYSE